MDLREKTNNNYRHPWELSRTYNLIHICREIISDKKTIIFGDIGSGDMYFDKQLIIGLREENIYPIICCVDNAYENLISSQNEILLFNDISLLEDNSIDCIIMMDVLEHIQDDSIFLKSSLEKLKEKGCLIITVPAFENLYSPHDVYLKHFRRYSYKGLRNLLLSNNLSIIKNHYFYSSLYIVRWLQLKLKRNKSEDKNFGIGMWKFSEENIITKGIEFLLNIDFRVNAILDKYEIHLPGLSLLAVAIKADKEKISEMGVE